MNAAEMKTAAAKRVEEVIRCGALTYPKPAELVYKSSWMQGAAFVELRSRCEAQTGNTFHGHTEDRQWSVRLIDGRKAEQP